jgi:hypothetical protein
VSKTASAGCQSYDTITSYEPPNIEPPIYAASNDAAGIQANQHHQSKRVRRGIDGNTVTSSATSYAETDPYDEFERSLDNLYGGMTGEELRRCLDDLNAERTDEEVERSIRADRIIHWQVEERNERATELVGIGAEDWVLSEDDRQYAADLIGADIVDSEFEHFKKRWAERREAGIKRPPEHWSENWRPRCQVLAEQMRDSPWLYRTPTVTGTSISTTTETDTNSEEHRDKMRANLASLRTELTRKR